MLCSITEGVRGDESEGLLAVWSAHHGVAVLDECGGHEVVAHAEASSVPLERHQRHICTQATAITPGLGTPLQTAQLSGRRPPQKQASIIHHIAIE
jgi:hypothetical protein